MKKVSKTEQSFEKTNEIKKLCLYVTIVNKGQANAVTSLFQRMGSALQYVEVGTGTANKNVLDILGIEDNAKEIVFALIKEELVKDASRELQAFFMASKKNKGIGFKVDLTSMIGVKLYRFLTNSL